MIFRPRKLLDPLPRIGNLYETEELYGLNIEETKRLKMGLTPYKLLG